MLAQHKLTQLAPLTQPADSYRYNRLLCGAFSLVYMLHSVSHVSWTKHNNVMSDKYLANERNVCV